MKYLILFISLVFIFSLFGCPNAGNSTDGRPEKAAKATVEFIKHIKKRDRNYILDNSALGQSIILTWPNGPEEARKLGFNNLDINLFWKEWPEALEDAKVDILRHEHVDSVYRFPRMSGEPVSGKLVPEISTEAYVVSLEIAFKNKFTALVQENVPLKRVVLVVTVYYDGDRDRYLIDWGRKKQLHKWDLYWLEQR